MTFLRTHLTTIVVAGVTALACSTGGAVAGSLITGAQIKDGTVTGADVKNKSLAKADLSTAAVKSLHGARGATGKTGKTGAPGLPGQDGGPGISGYEFIQTQKNVAMNTSDTVMNTCPAGKSIISANAFWQASREAVQVGTTASQAQAYTVGVPANDLLVLNIICATVAP